MADRGRPSEAKDDALALRVAMGDTVRAAAQAVKMAERTAYRRSVEPAFREKVKALRQVMLDGTMGILTAAGERAARTLDRLLGPELEMPATGEGDAEVEAVPAQVRRQAARDILELGGKLRGELELTERVEAIEAQLAGMNAPATPTETTT